MIIPNFTQFRSMFALTVPLTFPGGGGETLTFDAGAQTITRSIGNWLAWFAQHSDFMWIQVVGTASNDGWRQIKKATPAVLEFAAGSGIVNEAAVACSTLATYRDLDGYYTWPVANVRLPASGFGDTGSTITGIPRPIYSTIGGVSITCNGGAFDAVPGVDEYDWYLSQCTDDPARQLLFLQEPNILPNTCSGRVYLLANAANCRADIGSSITSGGPTAIWIAPDAVGPLFTHKYLYVQRRSDKAIQWVDLYRAQIAGV